MDVEQAIGHFDSYPSEYTDDDVEAGRCLSAEVQRLREALTTIQRMGDAYNMLVTAPMLADLAGQALEHSQEGARDRGSTDRDHNHDG